MFASFFFFCIFLELLFLLNSIPVFKAVINTPWLRKRILVASAKWQSKGLKTTLPKIHLQVFSCDSEDNSSTLLHIDSQEPLFKTGDQRGWARGSARPGAQAEPPFPCGAGRPGRRCSASAPAASRRAVGGRRRACTPRHSTAHGSGTAPSAGWTGCTRTRALRRTGTSWWGSLRRKENQKPLNNSGREGGGVGARWWEWRWDAHSVCTRFLSLTHLQC